MNPTEQIGKEQVTDIVESYFDNLAKERVGTETTRLKRIEAVVDDITSEYMRMEHYPHAGEKNSGYNREQDYAFIRASMESLKTEEDLTPIDIRIRASDLLTLHYAIVGGGIDHMVTKYVDQLSPEERAELEKEPEKIVEIGSEIAANFVAQQRRKNKERELLEKYSGAPTTGFEYEFADPLRRLLDEVKRVDRKIAILEALRDNDEEKRSANILDKSDKHFALSVIENIEEITEDEGSEVSRNWLEGYIIQKKNEQQRIQPLLRITQEIDYQLAPEEGTRRLIQWCAEKHIERSIQLLQEFSSATGIKISDSLREKYQRQLDLVLGKLKLEEGTDVATEDVNSMRLIVPSVTRRLSMTGPFGVIDEGTVDEEAITWPSASVRMQLRDFVYAAKMGAFSEHLGVHQNIAGVELTPDRTDFMEVTAILEAGDYNDPNIKMPGKTLEKIEAGSNAYGDPYKKVSICSNGREYYFPYHRVKTSGIVDYSRKTETLLELRAQRAFNQETSFSAHVRASTFTFLAAWGEQAANIDEADRTPEQRQLAEAWETLLREWKNVVSEKDIYQPQGSERYQEVQKAEGNLTFIGEEKYSLYLEQIAAKRIREEQQGTVDEPGSIRSQASKLIREYSRKVRDIIHY